MTDADEQHLQFDHVSLAGQAPVNAGVTCSNCGSTIVSEYYEANGHVVCATCKTRLEEFTEVPTGLKLFSKAVMFGFGGALVGALVYYAVLAITHFQIGWIAVFSGYAVGWMIRRATGGRGGLRFQLLAVFLTYLSIGMAYTPVVIQEVLAVQRTAGNTAGASTSAGNPTPPLPPRESPGRIPSTGGVRLPLPLRIVGLLIEIAGFVLALPVLVTVSSFPSGAISAVIIGVGLRQAWIMTRAAQLTVFGPYKIAGRSEIAPA